MVLRTDPNAEPIMAITVAGGGDLYQLRELADQVFRRRLEQIDGVAQAAVMGGDEREIRVEIDPRLLEGYGLTLQDISQAIARSNAAAAGGSIRRDRSRVSLRALGEFQAVNEIGDVFVTQRTTGAGGGPATGGGFGSAGNMLRLRDIATIEDGFRERQAEAFYNGSPAIGLLVFKESGSNTVRVAEQVEVVLDELREQYPDVEVDIAMSQAGFIADSISNVISSLVCGGLLAFLVLFLFLRDARYPVAIALAIPISVIGTFALLHAVGVTLNIMSLGGLALGVGMLVDNSIVVLENTFRHREKGLAAAAAAAIGAEEVQGAITASTLTTIAVFVPIVYIEGVAGQLFGAVSYAVGFSLIMSLIVAVTILPMLAARWAGGEGPGERGWVRRIVGWVFRPAAIAVQAIFNPLLNAFERWFERFGNWYDRLLARALDRRAVVVVAAILVVALGTFIGLTLERAVLPNVDQGAFVVRIDLPQGTALEATTALAQRIESVLLADEGVDVVFSRVGRQGALAGITSDDFGLNTALLDVRLAAGARTSEVLERVQARLADVPPSVLSFETGTVTSLGRLLGGGESDLAVYVRGEDIETNLAYADSLSARLASRPELRNVRLGTEIGQPEIRVLVDRDRAASVGVRAEAVVNAISTYMGGQIATDFVAFDRKIPVVVQLPEEYRRSLQTLDLLSVNGVPLRDLVTTSEVVTPTEVKRFSQNRVVPVYADAATRGLDRPVAAVQATLDEFPPPPGASIEIGGENEELRRSFRSLAFAFGLALVLVYMIMAAQFESFIHPFTILLSVPLALAGALAALKITGGGLNSMSLIGVVVLVGVVVNNAILLVDFINQRRRRGVPLREAILESGRARLRPIVMTTVTTVLGLLPMALGIGRGADLRAPLAIAVIGGLICSTALTLVIVPVAYDLIDAGAQRVRRLLRLSDPEFGSVQLPMTAGEPVPV
ncbi:MAG TPA: efflux RND transporter permease subunit, partial [Longimicrobiales bacterium]|nr:efflux RND transporter permease subunit [Longimicrobiales bacterium]